MAFGLNLTNIPESVLITLTEIIEYPKSYLNIVIFQFFSVNQVGPKNKAPRKEKGKDKNVSRDYAKIIWTWPLWVPASQAPDNFIGSFIHQVGQFLHFFPQLV